jgi:hypothetical protein
VRLIFITRGLLDRICRPRRRSPRSWARALGLQELLVMLRSLLIVSIMCTGMRIVRAWSAIARVIAWRIHQVA